MNLKELTVKEALLLLAEKTEPVVGSSNNSQCELIGIYVGCKLTPFVINGKDGIKDVDNFSIEVEPEHRYMTQQECIDWICLHGYKGYQVSMKEYEGSWMTPSDWNYENAEQLLYRTIQEIDGRIVYGEPMEFRVQI